MRLARHVRDVRLDWIVVGVDAQGTGKLLPPRGHTPSLPPLVVTVTTFHIPLSCFLGGILRKYEVGAVVKRGF